MHDPTHQVSMFPSLDTSNYMTLLRTGLPRKEEGGREEEKKEGRERERVRGREGGRKKKNKNICNKMSCPKKV